MAIASVNEVHLLGRVGRDPELRYLPSGTAQATTSIATDRMVHKGGRDSNEYEKLTDWHRLTLWTKTAEAFGEQVAQGDVVEIHGRLSSRSWDKDDGTKGYATDVVVERFEVVEQASRRPKAAPGRPQTVDPRWESTSVPQAVASAGGADPDDLPFE